MADNIFAADPRGFEVECADERFRRIQNKHPETARFLTKAIIREAIEKPQHRTIYSSPSNPNRHIYYGKRYPKFEIKVVVDFNSKLGTIVTFHACSRRPPEERMIWPITNQ
ncbi:MAG: hypothetical protein EPO32_12795 [Anaerolineae bacterium]|nr:MAG: hypothetical protein EPO32_12795 [Anaerolineae bacterium]